MVVVKNQLHLQTFILLGTNPDYLRTGSNITHPKYIIQYTGMMTYIHSVLLSSEIQALYFCSVENQIQYENRFQIYGVVCQDFKKLKDSIYTELKTVYAI